MCIMKAAEQRLAKWDEHIFDFSQKILPAGIQLRNGLSKVRLEGSRSNNVLRGEKSRGSTL